MERLFSQISGVADSVLGLSLKAEELGYGHMAARALLMYVTLIGVIRAAKKRFLGQPTAFDMILVIVLGSIAARALTGGSPFFPSVLGLLVIVAAHWVFSLLARDSRWFSNLIKGHPTRLILDGRIDRNALRAAHMSDDDLDEELRQQGLRDPRAVTEARLERSGKLSVIKSQT
ncbi:DUF421 domain-containing protein [Rhodoplanes sp. Z2-YC6860]|uniref:DUF421 domain-containing protein n=1 Tax=Rhodoplanes sp. Z2-YC6860 TaxID=674703 RepID=UPI00078D842A|nr:YetF domain-containing protein [Rhodoplanes sp. Z2-YC6860]AMN44201.1 membrane-associated protein [Rhodoplanes sp. Z2-YC6860]